MKHTYYHIIALLLSVCVIYGCRDESTDVYEDTGLIKLSSELLQVSSTEAGRVIRVDGIANFEIDSSTTEAWCQLLKVDPYEEKRYVSCRIEENKGAEERETSFEVYTDLQRIKVSIKQLGSEPQILLSKDSLHVGRDTNVLRVKVLSNVAYEIIADGDWYQLNKQENENEDLLLISLSPNNTGEERLAYIQLKSDFDIADKTLFLKQSTGTVKYVPEGQEDVAENQQIEVISATASSFTTGRPIDYSYDGSTATYYQSDWQDINEPIVLEYQIAGDKALSYIEYLSPYANDLSKNFKNVEIWVKSEGGDYEHARTLNFPKTDETIVIDFDEDFENPVAVKFVVNSVYSNNPEKIIGSCAEMKFYSTAVLYDHIFTDKTCSELKAGVSLNEILSLEDDFYRNLAYHLHHGTYEDFRIRNYEAYRDPSLGYYTMQGKYSSFDNATGISVKIGERLIVMADHLSRSNPVYVQVLNPKVPGLVSEHKLQEGVNRFGMPFDGLIYIKYHTYTGIADPVRIHICGGDYNGIYRKGDGNVDLQFGKSDYIDLIGEKAHLIFRKEDLADVASFDELLETYDKIINLQHEFMGLDKYGVEIKSRMLFLATESNKHIADKKDMVLLPVEEMSNLCNVDSIIGGDSVLWDLSHKIADINVIKGLLWSGLEECMPNLYSLYVEKEMGFPSRLEKRQWYEKAIKNILIPEASLRSFANSYGFMNERIVPMWQLQIYAEQVLNKPDFYKDLHNKLQRYPYSYDYFFTLEVCNLLDVDLTTFFKAWGFKYSGKELTNQAPKALKYINEKNVELFKNPQAPVAGTYQVAGNIVFISDSENIVAYEVRHSYHPTQVFTEEAMDNMPMFGVENWSPSMKIIGIGTDGEEVEIIKQ